MNNERESKATELHCFVALVGRMFVTVPVVGRMFMTVPVVGRMFMTVPVVGRMFVLYQWLQNNILVFRDIMFSGAATSCNDWPT